MAQLFGRTGRILSALLTLPMLSLVLVTGCSKSETTEVASAPAGGAENLPPAKEIPPGALVETDITPGKKGGTLVLSLTGDPKTFNEPISEDTASSAVTSYLFEGLYGFDNIEQTDVPALAESWEYNEATREWTFHLREGLKWSDGEPLTSDDLLFYTEIVFDPSVPTPIKEYFQSGGERFKFSAPDPRTFVAQIPTVDSFAILNLGLMKAFPRHKYESALKSGKFAEILGINTPPSEFVGSGAYKLKSFTSGQQLVLEANPHYYRYDERGTQLPYAKELIFLNVADAAAMALRFQAGDIDYHDTAIQPQDLTTLQDNARRGEYTIYNPGLALTNTHYWFNLKAGGTYDDGSGKRARWTPSTPDEEPPADIKAKDYRPFVDPVKRKWFANRDFRIACSMATNRDAMVKTVLFGEGVPIYGPVEPSNKQWYNEDIPKYPFNLEEAKKLLDGIGFVDRNNDGVREDPNGNPIRFTMITNKENNVRSRVAVLLKEDLAKAGIAVTTQVLDFNDIITRTADSYDYESVLLGIAAGVPPHPAMGANSWKSAGRLHSFNPEQETPATPEEAKIDQLYESLKTKFTHEEQKEIFDEMQRIWCEQQWMIHLFTGELYVAAKDKIGNVKPSVLRPYLTHNIHEHYLK